MVKFIKKIVRSILNFLYRYICPNCYKTYGTAAPITIKGWFFQKVLGFNKYTYWPTHFTSKISYSNNIKIGVGTAPGISPGCYIQGMGKIIIGDYTIMAANVGIISANHEIYDSKKHIKTTVTIGKHCWIAMNSVILPNVTLGDFVIVGAGSVVTKSFEEGFCVIAGSPAKIIKRLDKSKCQYTQNTHKYHGFIKEKNFEQFKKNKLDF